MHGGWSRWSREYNGGFVCRTEVVKYIGWKRGGKGGMLDQHAGAAAEHGEEGEMYEAPERTRGTSLNGT